MAGGMQGQLLGVRTPARRLICSNLNKYASISDFEHAVNHVNGVELTEGLYWR